MRRIIFVFSLFLLLGESPIIAQYYAPDVFTPGQRLMIQATEHEYPYFLHKVQPRQTLYSIARAYGTPIPELLEYNIGLQGRGLKKDEILRIPLSANKFVTRLKDRSDRFVSVYYQVQRGQTLFHIAHRLFKIPLFDLSYNNDVSDQSISPGDRLLIGWINLDPQASSPVVVSIDEPQLPTSTPVHPYTGLPTSEISTDTPAVEERLELVEEKGAAYWNKNSRNRSGFFVLSSTIPAGTDVELFNPMSRRSVFATVVSNIPDGIYPDEIIAIISPEAAESLRVMDQKFYLHIRYLQ